MKKKLKSWANSKNSQWHSGIVVEEHKLVFMYALKSGCSSIKRMFLDDLGYGPDREPSQRLLSLHTAKQIHEKCKGWLKIGIVRNPYNRALSTWYEKTQVKDFKDFHQFGIYRGIPFKDFLRIVSQYDDYEIDRHLKSQKCFMCYPGDNVLPQSYYHLEWINTKWPVIQNQVKVHTQGRLVLPDLKEHNRTGSSKYNVLWDDEAGELVRRRYADDFRIFGFAQ